MNEPKVTLRGIQKMCFGREVTIDLSGAFEARLREHLKRLDPSITPPDEPYDESVKIALEALIDRGLTESEKDVGLAATYDGMLIPRPIISFRRRLRHASNAFWREFRR